MFDEEFKLVYNHIINEFEYLDKLKTSKIDQIIYYLNEKNINININDLLNIKISDFVDYSIKIINYALFNDINENIIEKIKNIVNTRIFLVNGYLYVMD